MMKKSDAAKVDSASRRIDARIEELDDWRGAMLARLRALILEADPQAVEEWKWENPVWSHEGLICTGETYKKAVKLTFAKGASVDDPAWLFNSSLEGKVRRAIDFHEGEKVNEKAFKALIRAAVELNTAVASVLKKQVPVETPSPEPRPWDTRVETSYQRLSCENWMRLPQVSLRTAMVA